MITIQQVYPLLDTIKYDQIMYISCFKLPENFHLSLTAMKIWPTIGSMTSSAKRSVRQNCSELGCRLWRSQKRNLVGGWATPLKNISQLGWLFPIYGKIKNVPNHQPDHDYSNSISSLGMWRYIPKLKVMNEHPRFGMIASQNSIICSNPSPGDVFRS